MYKLERIGIILDRESCSIEDERSSEWPRVYTALRRNWIFTLRAEGAALESSESSENIVVRDHLDRVFPLIFMPVDKDLIHDFLRGKKVP